MNRIANISLFLAAFVLWFGYASIAHAHGFSPELGAYRQIKIGAKLVLYQTEILVLLVSLGLLLSFLDQTRLRLGWAALCAGLLVGFPLAFVVQFDVIWIALGLMIIAGGLIAVNRFLTTPVILAVLAAGSACILPLGFLGHTLSDLPPLILGNFLFTSGLVALAGALLSLLARHFSHVVWVPIVVRVLGSWLSAIAILIFAFFVGMPA